MSKLNIIDELASLKQFVWDRQGSGKAVFNVLNGCRVTFETETKRGLFKPTEVIGSLVLIWQPSGYETQEHVLRISNEAEAEKFLEAMKLQSRSLEA